MAREVDKAKTRKALRRLKRVVERVETLSESGQGEKLTEWEKGFVAGVTERLETYGSAFRDPMKGALEEALSARQTQITRALEKKTRGKAKAEDGKPADQPKPPFKPRSSFKPKKPVRVSRDRDINDDMLEAESAPQPAARPPVKGRAKLKVVEGGRTAKPANGDRS
jgi:hypothetical protein